MDNVGKKVFGGHAMTSWTHFQDELDVENLKETIENSEERKKSQEEKHDVSEDLDNKDDLEKKIEDLESEILKNRAEIENIQKRHKEECEKIRSYGISNFAKEILNVLDDMDRALKCRPEGEESSSFDNFWKGIKMTQKNLNGVLECFGVEKINAIGKEFNPQYHEAMGQEVSDVYPQGFVSTILQDGYILGKRLLRPALVKVSQGQE